jgi:isocitrate dehydrogenase
MEPEKYSVIATTNLNGDYISDAWPPRSEAWDWPRA